jgi:hypothetical protein
VEVAVATLVELVVEVLEDLDAQSQLLVVVLVPKLY